MREEIEKIERRSTLSVVAVVSFALSFAVARTFTALNPRVILSPSGFHVHHFWYGIVMLAVGAWLVSATMIRGLIGLIQRIRGGLRRQEIESSPMVPS